jgi:hypothetical protein
MIMTTMPILMLAAIGGHAEDMSTTKQDEPLSPPKEVPVQESSQTVTPAEPPLSTKQRGRGHCSSSGVTGASQGTYRVPR